MSSNISGVEGCLACLRSNKGDQCGQKQVSKGESKVNETNQARWMRTSQISQKLLSIVKTLVFPLHEMEASGEL